MQALFLVCATVSIYKRVPFLFYEMLFYNIIGLFAAYCICYVQLYKSKKLFITQKQIQQMIKEQYLIVKNLPDGALVHR